jgi:hypothetical protein
MAKKPRQKKLPTMEDSAIQPLENAAHEYVEIRDERMGLAEREVTAKGVLLKLMKKHSKTHYHRNGLDITVVPEAETVKVRVKKAKEDADA